MYECNNVVYEISKQYWENTDWNFYKIMPERAVKQELYLKNKFIPLLNRTDTLGDLACSNGVYTMQVAPYVKEVDAWDISEKMILKAKITARHKGINNINFTATQAEEVEYKKTYDAFMLLGLLTCLESDEVCNKIVTNVASTMKKDGYLVIKDTVMALKRKIYINNDYATVYRAEEEYLMLFLKHFKLIDIEYLGKNTNATNGNNSASIICLLKKR